MVNTELIRILIIDDDEDDFVLTASFINEIPNGRFQIDWCSKYSTALEKLCNKEYDIYFIDYFLGGLTGMDLLRNAILCNEDSPMILLTGKGNREISFAALGAGAFDYLIKSELNAEKLERCIRYSLEKAAAFKKIRDNEKKLRTIFEKTKDGIFLADLKMNLIDANPSMERLSGYSSAELKKMVFYDLVVSEVDQKRIENLIKTNNLINEVEIEIQHASGEYLNCIFSSVIVQSPNGDKIIQGVLNDITKLRKAERSLLMVEKLAAAGRLAKTLAHEIRNPLTNINLSVDHLKGIENTDLQLHYLEIIGRNSLRINEILSELLATSKPPQTAKKIFVLQDILNLSINTAMDRIILKNIKLYIKFEEKPILVNADQDMLSMAFLNIIINAVEAMEEYRGELIISISGNNEKWEVRITDNGVGIHEDDIPKLFEPYFTVKRNGMGLGLSSVLNILQAHNAKIDVTSVLGLGSTFFIVFPVTCE